MQKTYHELVRGIRDAVRKKAQEIPKFKESGNGAIRILAYPLCRKADEWLGGLSTFAHEYGKYIDPTDTVKVGVDDIVDYEHTFAITPGGRRVITGKWDDDTESQTVDCYAYSALKIAHCSRVQDEGAGLLSGIGLKIPYLTEGYGYADHPGALCIEISTRMASIKSRNTIEFPFCLLYVCVSGADSKDDQKCALASIEVVREFFLNEGLHFHLNVPNVSNE